MSDKVFWHDLANNTAHHTLVDRIYNVRQDLQDALDDPNLTYDDLLDIMSRCKSQLEGTHE